jgi:hypothetical protein
MYRELDRRMNQTANLPDEQVFAPTESDFAIVPFDDLVTKS